MPLRSSSRVVTLFFYIVLRFFDDHFMFEYDHSMLSLAQLHASRIRNTKELEEVIEGYSFANEIFLPEHGYAVLLFTGFTKSSKPIKVACRFDGNSKITTLDAMIPHVDEIIEGFCKYC